VTPASTKASQTFCAWATVEQKTMVLRDDAFAFQCLITASVISACREWTRLRPCRSPSPCADVFQCVLHADIDHESTRRNQVPGRDHLAQSDLVGHVGKDIAQALAIAAIRRGSQAADASIEDCGPAPSRSLPGSWATTHGALRRSRADPGRHLVKMGLTRQGLHHGKRRLTATRTSRWHRTRTCSCQDSRANLVRFWPVSSVRCARMHALASGSTNTLPATADSMMVLPDPVGATASVFPYWRKRRQGALDQLGLTGTEHHDGGPPLLRPAGTTRNWRAAGGLRIGVGCLGAWEQVRADACRPSVPRSPCGPA
jgi:hypothetical protein